MSVFTTLASCWLLVSLSLIGYILLARRRRRSLAQELHEVRGALATARLAVELLPSCEASDRHASVTATSELERSCSTLAEFERLLHKRLLAPSIGRERAPRIAEGHQPESPSFDARSELDRLALVWNEASRQQGRALVFTWRGPDDPVIVGGVQRHFTEVIANLLGNALRHGEGAIELRATVRSDSLRVEVCDEGPGLSGALAGVARRPQRGEHGHGLSVARRASRALGGTLESAPSRAGARLVFNVPALHRPQARRSISEPNIRQAR